jgi:hypothetical protein
MNEINLRNPHEDTEAPITSILALAMFGVIAGRIDF